MFLYALGYYTIPPRLTGHVSSCKPNARYYVTILVRTFQLALNLSPRRRSGAVHMMTGSTRGQGVGPMLLCRSYAVSVDVGLTAGTGVLL